MQWQSFWLLGKLIMHASSSHDVDIIAIATCMHNQSNAWRKTVGVYAFLVYTAWICILILSIATHSKVCMWISCIAYTCFRFIPPR